VPQGTDAHLLSEVLAKFLQRAIRLGRDGRAEGSLVPEVEGLPLGGVGAGCNLAGLSEAFVEDADPLSRDGVLAGDGGVGHPALAVGQDPLTQVE
jgi:hypothetical protein